MSRLLATWFYSGLSPKAPGTVGSIAALPVAALLIWLGGPATLALGAALSLPLGVWAAEREAARCGEHDPKHVVIDEVCGMWIALIPVAIYGGPAEWIVAFAAFRALDILKPGPIGWADRSLKGGWGVMMDDVFAGLGAAMTVYLFAAARALPFGGSIG